MRSLSYIYGFYIAACKSSVGRGRGPVASVGFKSCCIDSISNEGFMIGTCSIGANSDFEQI